VSDMDRGVRLLGKVAKAIRSLPEVGSALREAKAKARKRLKGRDFIWKELVGSIGNWGGTRGSKRLKKDKRWRYRCLCALGSPKKRARMLERVLVECGVNRARSKAPLLAQNFEMVQALGGPTRVRKLLLDLPDREAKIAFLMDFHGVGPKYGRNILMDGYHPEFRDSIAYDARLGAIARRLGLEFKTYEDAEEFFLRAAGHAGVEGWELDRMIWLFTEKFACEIERSA
jgi:hypothetical protein